MADDPLQDIGERGLAAHTFNAPDQTGSHRVVATAMLVTFTAIFISRGWWKTIRDFVLSKTHGPAEVSPPGGSSGKSK